MQIVARFDDARLSRELDELEIKGGRTAVANALNRTRTKVLKPAFEEIAAAKGLAVSRVTHRYDKGGKRKGPRIRFSRASPENLSTGWDWLPKRRPGKVAMIQLLGVKQNTFGVTARAVSVKSAFITSARSQRSFEKKTRKRKGKKVQVDVLVANKQVYKREGKSPYPLVVQRFDLNPEADAIMSKHVSRVVPTLETRSRERASQNLKA